MLDPPDAHRAVQRPSPEVTDLSSVTEACDRGEPGERSFKAHPGRGLHSARAGSGSSHVAGGTTGDPNVKVTAHLPPAPAEMTDAKLPTVWARPQHKGLHFLLHRFLSFPTSYNE